MCRRGVASATALQDHMLIHLCPGGCGNMFPNDKILKDHMLDAHGMKITKSKRGRGKECVNQTKTAPQSHTETIKEEIINSATAFTIDPAKTVMLDSNLSDNKSEETRGLVKKEDCDHFKDKNMFTSNIKHTMNRLAKQLPQDEPKEKNQKISQYETKVYLT